MEPLILITLHDPETLEELSATEAIGEVDAMVSIKQCLKRIKRKESYEESKYIQTNEGTTGD